MATADTTSPRAWQPGAPWWGSQAPEHHYLLLPHLLWWGGRPPGSPWIFGVLETLTSSRHRPSPGRIHRKGLHAMLKRFPLDGTVAPEMPTTLWSWASPSTLCMLKKPYGSQKNLPNPPSWVGSTGMLGEEVFPLWGTPLGSKPLRKRTSRGAVQLWVQVHSSLWDSEPCGLATASLGDRDVMESLTLLLLIRVRTRITLMIHVLGFGWKPLPLGINPGSSQAS